MAPQVLYFILLPLFSQAPPAATQPAAESLTIELRRPPGDAPDAPVRFTARISPESLAALFESDQLPAPFRAGAEKASMLNAIERVNMAALVDEIAPFLERQFARRFQPDRDMLVRRVPDDKQLAIDAADIFDQRYFGPKNEIVGLLIHDVTEREYIEAALRILQRARQLYESGDPVYDRRSDQYWRWLADRELAEIRDARRRGDLSQVEKNETRRRIAKALGIEDNQDASTAPNWLKESRRFSYIIRDGQFIERLRPLVERINREMEIAGFAPPGPLDKPGIYFDPEIGDVDIVLPRDMLTDFLAQADEFERRMAEDAIISIEAVRLTDREIIEGAIATRMNAQIQGVHDVERFNRKSVFTELGLNSLIAVANQQLTAQTLSGVGSGALPIGTPPITVAPPTLPPIRVGNEATVLGLTFSVGADDVFFDGRQQVTGFSYIGPDGIAHTMTTETVDSLRELWERIERNLIVHKIKKTGTLTEFSVPVGPNTRTYKGIAALISQENQQLVVATGTGAISEIQATAGTWLVIEDFNIAPIPGSSTTLSREERDEIRLRVLLTMFLRDPFAPVDVKRELLAAASRSDLSRRLNDLLEMKGPAYLRPGDPRRTYSAAFADRLNAALADEAVEKKEENSSITLTFFSSQGNIIQSPGTTQLGDANDLTSFTTVLSPNEVTPISSFFTKTGSGLEGSSIMTDLARGERINNEKSMTHLLIRARFPTRQRELADRVEGPNLGYYELPLQRKPPSDVDVPFLSSSEHPCQRLAKFRFGLMFPVLDRSRIKRPLNNANPNRFPGDVPPDAWRTATTRLMLIQRIIADAGGSTAGLPADYVRRFETEVRSLLEYDEDFFRAPNIALRNMRHWNDPERIIRALDGSPGRFALSRLVAMLDELGAALVPDEYARQYLAWSPDVSLFKWRRVYPLDDDTLWRLRRDVAVHFLRLREAYGDSFLEAAANLLQLGTYRATEESVLVAAPFVDYRYLVVMDQSGSLNADPELYRQAQEDFLFLKQGGHVGALFEKSFVELDHLAPRCRALFYRGSDILTTLDLARDDGY